MNHFERVAIFTTIENIENQLRGLKTLIAASAAPHAPVTHKTTPTMDHDSHELSEDDEEKLQKELEHARTVEIERMRKAAEATFQGEWAQTSDAMSKMNG